MQTVEQIATWERARTRGPSEVRILKDARSQVRYCTMIEVKQSVHRSDSDREVMMEQVFVDDELKLPIRFAAYGWPEVYGAKPPLLFGLTFMSLRLNVSLSDQDFDPAVQFKD